MKRKFLVWASIWLSLSLPVLACGIGKTTSTTLETAAIVTPKSADPTSGVSEKIWIEQEAYSAHLAELARIEAERQAAEEAERLRKQRAREQAARAALRASRTKGPASGDLLDRLAQCESGGDPAKNTGNGYFGAFQWLPSTWWNLTRPTKYVKANYQEAVNSILSASYADQKAVAAKIPLSAWDTQFPGCAKKLGVS